jgi:hypothetical protein
MAAVRDDPSARLALAARFYDSTTTIRPYRRATLAFMRWQIRRGVPSTSSARDHPRVHRRALRHARARINQA